MLQRGVSSRMLCLNVVDGGCSFAFICQLLALGSVSILYLETLWDTHVDERACIISF